MARESTVDRPKRRAYSTELKAQVLEECRRRGASVAGVALSHSLNPNMVHRWIREEHQRSLVTQSASQQFVALQLQGATVIDAQQATPEPTVPACSSQDTTIQIEVRRGAATVSVRWPVEAAAACTAWLRDWLR